MKSIYALGIGALLCFGNLAQAAPAVRIDDLNCGLLDGDGGSVVTDRSHAVVTSAGPSMLKCQVNDVPNSTGRAVIWNHENTGYSCYTPAGETDDWKITVSASG
ncbi:MAG: hypothetical protein RIR26_59, partial [Pseudomonadota bacterium]